MGDRAMAEIKTEGGSLFFYTHWGGFDLPENAAKAIVKAQPRANDLPYETRIIVDQLTKEGRDQETGFGLMLDDNAGDEYNNDKPSVIIDLITRDLTIKRDNKISTSHFVDLYMDESLKPGS